MRYRAAGRESDERTVEPLGLVVKGSVWYLVAGTPKGLRTFRVSRIEAASVLEAPSARPAGFDLAAYWTAAAEELRTGRKAYEATLRLERRAAESIRFWRPTSPAPAEGSEPEGWVTVNVSFEDEEQAVFVALGLGPRADVVEPAGLRRRVAADIAEMSRRRGRRT
jgi:predicted DNA-binding transcriptional regulator YafY